MTLFDLEINYQKFRKQIKLPSTTSFKLKLISQFLIPLIKESNQKKYLSYYCDLIPVLFDLIQKKELAHYTPEEIEQILGLLNFVENDTQFENLRHRFRESKEILNSSKIKILKILGNDLPNKIESLSSDSLAIVLVERNDNNGLDNIIETGFIHKLLIYSEIRQKSETEDKIEFKNLFDINETEILKHLNFVVSKAKSECERKDIKTHSYYYTYQFDRQDCVYTGSSLGLGAICLAYNSVLINELQKYYFKFKGDCVFTGEIDVSGNLQKLDDESLRLKLKTVFFSDYRKFIIPEENIPEAKEELEKLNERYPERQLKLLPIKNFLDVFDNHEVVEQYELKFLQKLKLNYKKYHRAANWMFSIISFAIICFFVVFYLIPHLDRNPETSAYVNDRFIAFNKYGVKVWESKQMDKVNKLMFPNKDEFERRIILSDINNDKYNEILYIVRSDTSSLQNRSIFCYNSDNSIKWIYNTPNKQIIYNNILYPDLFQTYGLYIFEREQTKEKYIFYTGNLNEEFPFCIVKLDCNGKFLSEFWHSGHLPHIKFFDIEKDGNNELVAAYCNNKYKRASLIIFDPANVNGASPETDPLQDNKKGTEKYYILFPRTILNYYSGRDINNVVNLDQYNGEGINVTVCESEMKNGGENDFVIYKFNKKMEVIEVILSSPWIGNYETLVFKKIIEPIKDLKSYTDSLKNAVQYWDGEKFVNFTTINNHYPLHKSVNIISKK